MRTRHKIVITTSILFILFDIFMFHQIIMEKKSLEIENDSLQAKLYQISQDSIAVKILYDHYYRTRYTTYENLKITDGELIRLINARKSHTGAHDHR